MNAPTVNRYYPIKNDPNYSRAEYERGIFDATIEGWGNLKKTGRAARTRSS